MARRSHDWKKAKAYFLSDNTLTYGDVSKKFRIPLQTVNQKGSKEQWRDQRKVVQAKAEEKTIEKLPERISNVNLKHLEEAKLIREAAVEELRRTKDRPKKDSDILNLWRAAVKVEREILGLDKEKPQDDLPTLITDEFWKLPKEERERKFKEWKAS